MGKALDLTGQQFGHLTALRPIGGTRTIHRKWICRCVCGKNIAVTTSNLTRGNSTSCGCVRIHDIHGQSFGRLQVTKPVRVKGKKKWLCRCDCGSTITVIASHLVNGVTRSCGCLRSDMVSERSITHGYTTDYKEHPLYSTWLNMNSRCHSSADKAYDRYGGRGITVCDRWRYDFAAFLNDMGEKPTPEYTLERIDNDGNYSPENCIWASRTEQARNTRSNVLLTYDGETKTIAEWAEIAGMSYFSFRSRIKRGWTPARAITTPIDTTRRNKLARQRYGV